MADVVALSNKKRVNAFIAAQAKLDTLRIVTCGSVDDGKSTLIGRMLYEAKAVFDDQVAALKNDSRKRGSANGPIDFSLLVDGLSSEREQGITIDVAYRYFSTDKRRFVIADTPGHEQYTRNMVTGASNADLAVLLIDATKGVVVQTRRHAFICARLGIRHVVLAINKMDLVDFSQSVFDKISADFSALQADLRFETITPIPLSATLGDNITTSSNNTPWYRGMPLFAFLETVDVRTKRDNAPLRLPIQWVCRPNADFRGYAGTIASGNAFVGQEVRILPSGTTAQIKDILAYTAHPDLAPSGSSPMILLDRDVDVSRGDVIVEAQNPCECADQFEATLVWMDAEPGYSGRSYLLKLGTTTVNARITALKCKVDPNTYERVPATKFEMNDICLATLALDKPIAFESYEACPSMGSFILIDRIEHSTVAAGMIHFALRRAQNVHLQKLDIDKQARQRLNGHKSKVLWFTGLSGSGKSTLANALEKELFRRGIRTYILDGDNVRHGLNQDLGFTEADRVENIRRIAEVAKLMVDAGLVVLIAFISPFQTDRDMARALFAPDEFVEIFVDTPLEIAESRDTKGLYQKARRGQIPNFTGINSPYEPPPSPEFHLHTEAHTVDELVAELISKLDFAS